MKLIVIKNGKAKLNNFLEWVLYILCYGLVFIAVSSLFDSFYIDTNYFGMYGFLAVIIIYILNKTIKPILVYLTLPITGFTMGLFYPFINVFLLKLTDFILGGHLDFTNFWVLVLVAIMISVINTVMEQAIIKPIIRRFKHE